jgi:N-acyl-D-aspartate/D-glutamate deacylase
MDETFDLIVRGGTVVDGTGLPRRRVDVGVIGDRVAKIAHLKSAHARAEIDATGCIVAPGLVDIHTHYDPHVTFDPWASMALYHGTTTVVAGNCGFSAAPCGSGDRDFLQGIFASVEDMDPIALSAVAWDQCVSFREFLDSRRDHLGLNFACYIGHSNVRRAVMGEEASTREATRTEIEAMAAIVRDAMTAGAAGLSSARTSVHVDGRGRPLPSSVASIEELKYLVSVLADHGAGSFTFLPRSLNSGLDDEDRRLLADLSALSGLPVIIQGIGGRSKMDVPSQGWASAKKYLDDTTEAGTPVISLLVNYPYDRSFRIDETNALFPSVPSWVRMMNLPATQRAKLLRDRQAREEMRFAVENYNSSPGRGTSTISPPRWDKVYIWQTVREEHRDLVGTCVADVATTRGVAPGDFVLDLALSENFETEFRWNTDSDAWQETAAEVQRDPRIVVSISDGGAHLARDDGAGWSSYFLRHWVFEKQVWTLEEGIRQITHIPASVVGLSDRGLLHVGSWADMFVFNPETIAPGPKVFVRDLPGGVGRFRAEANGVRATIVNGVPVILDGRPTGALPGRVVSPTAFQSCLG